METDIELQEIILRDIILFDSKSNLHAWMTFFHPLLTRVATLCCLKHINMKS